MTDWKKYYLRFVGSAALNAGIFTAYRLYVHYRKNKLTFLNLEDFKAYDTYPYKILDFNGQEDKLNLLKFENVDDDLGTMEIATLKYKDVFCSFHRYLKGNIGKNQYTLKIDIQSCADNRKTFSQIGEGLIKALGFETAKVTWKNNKLEPILENFLKK